MHNANVNAAWELIIARKVERKESRIAFIAALLMDRTRNAQSRSAIAAGDESELSPFMAEQFAVELVRLAGRIHRHAENECNREVSETEAKTDEANQARFHALAAALGFEARTGGDPRGACAYLIDPDDRKGDGWGEGWAVYA